MEQEQYWYNKSCQDKINVGLEQEAIMNLLYDQKEMLFFAALKPKVTIDGDQYCILYGENLIEGISGFGKTIMEAIRNFNKSFHTPLPSPPKQEP